MAWRLVFRNNLEPIYVNVCSSGMRSDLFVGCCRQHLLCDSKKRIHSSALGHSPTKTGEQLRKKKLVDKVKTPVGHGLASSKDIIGGNDGSKGHAVQHTSLEGHSPTKTRGRPRQKKLSDKVKTHVGHELASIEDIAGGNAGSNGHAVHYTSRQALSDEKFRAEMDEIAKKVDLRSWGTHEGGKVYLNGVCYDSASDPTYRRKRCENFVKIAKSIARDVPPGKESLYETLCRLRGRRPFTEDPVYQEEQRQEAARLEARSRRRAQQREKSSSLS